MRYTMSTQHTLLRAHVWTTYGLHALVELLELGKLGRDARAHRLVLGLERVAFGESRVLVELLRNVGQQCTC
jgi:hypothetical protein